MTFKRRLSLEPIVVVVQQLSWNMLTIKGTAVWKSD